MIIFAINQAGNLIKTEDQSAVARDDRLAVYLRGEIAFIDAPDIWSIPLIYAHPDSQIDFRDARQWLERSAQVAHDYIDLIERIGAARALELLLTGARINCQPAWQYGLINEILLPPEFELRLAGLSHLSASAIKLAIELSRRNRRLTRAQAEIVERYTFALRFSHPDQSEGMRAFLEKRAPKYQGSGIREE
jgi:hypothetical protein